MKDEYPIEKGLKKEMTAKKIEDKIFNDGANYGSHNCSSQTCDYTEKERIKLIKEYAKQKCREQIELCRWWFDNDDEEGRADSSRFLNAPMPKFD